MTDIVKLTRKQTKIRRLRRLLMEINQFCEECRQRILEIAMDDHIDGEVFFDDPDLTDASKSNDGAPLASVEPVPGEPVPKNVLRPAFRPQKPS
jgi:hypothetical protein